MPPPPMSAHPLPLTHAIHVQRNTDHRRADQHAVFTKNCREIKTDARTWELLDSAKRRHAYAICLHQTWRAGAATETYCDSWYTLVGWGSPLQQGRGSVVATVT